MAPSGGSRQRNLVPAMEAKRTVGEVQNARSYRALTPLPRPHTAMPRCAMFEPH
jgi:hypothetical protein